ncbi:MAG: class II SORL domain-containing protein [Deltaproteobacteria bacterium]
MNRRTFLKTAALGTVVGGISASFASAERYFPVKADQSLFENINKVKDVAKKSPLEKKHAPVITAPASVKAGEPFIVDIAVGEILHDMGPAHWIEYIDLAIGNEPAGRADFQAKGYLKPKCTFSVVIPKEAAPAGKVTLIASERCNLHGYWESSIDILVT